MRVPFSYLDRQFGSDRIPEFAHWRYTDKILRAIQTFIPTGDFTLGKHVEAFEQKFARFIGVKHAIGVGSGTDALMLSLKAVGVQAGDEVITSAQTFIATAGAIAAVGATPVFIDVNNRYIIDEAKIEAAITPRTKAIIPVWFTGDAPQMDTILEIARAHNLAVVEDSCCAIDASYKDKKAGSWGATGTFSFHPLKNLNVWSDGGMITTNDDALAKKLKLLRNHGLKNRDEVEIFGYNSRLDSLQAVVALQMLPDVTDLTNKRIQNAQRYDEAFKNVEHIDIPPRNQDTRHVYHLYMLRVQNRDELLKHCIDNGVESKIHYPIPLPYQTCCAYLGYKPGDFPKTERDTQSIITLPSHPYLTDKEIDYTIETIKNFYA